MSLSRLARRHPITLVLLLDTLLLVAGHRMGAVLGAYPVLGALWTVLVIPAYLLGLGVTILSVAIVGPVRPPLWWVLLAIPLRFLPSVALELMLLWARNRYAAGTHRSFYGPTVVKPNKR